MQIITTTGAAECTVLRWIAISIVYIVCTWVYWYYILIPVAITDIAGKFGVHPIEGLPIELGDDIIVTHHK